MSILEILKLITGASATGLVDLLKGVSAKAPDLAPLAEEWIAKIATAASPANLLAVNTAVVAELANIAQGKLDPHDHPSDSI